MEDKEIIVILVWKIHNKIVGKILLDLKINFGILYKIQWMTNKKLIKIIIIMESKIQILLLNRDYRIILRKIVKKNKRVD